MPNRILKESICTSEDLDKLSPGAEILFYRLIVQADDYGCYYGNSSIIKSNCFPLKSDEINCKQVESWLAELENAGLIMIYTADDCRKYVCFCKWEKHQTVRAKKRKFPEPPPIASICKHLQADESKCSRNPIQSNPIQNPIQSESNAGEYASAALSPADDPPKEPEKLKKRKPEEVAHKHGEYGWVKLTDTQYSKLITDLGPTEAQRCIDYVDMMAQSTGNKNHWTDWNLVVRRCHREAWGIHGKTTASATPAKKRVLTAMDV